MVYYFSLRHMLVLLCVFSPLGAMDGDEGACHTSLGQHRGFADATVLSRLSHQSRSEGTHNDAQAQVLDIEKAAKVHNEKLAQVEEMAKKLIAEKEQFELDNQQLRVDVERHQEEARYYEQQLNEQQQGSPSMFDALYTTPIDVALLCQLVKQTEKPSLIQVNNADGTSLTNSTDLHDFIEERKDTGTGKIEALTDENDRTQLWRSVMSPSNTSESDGSIDLLVLVPGTWTPAYKMAMESGEVARRHAYAVQRDVHTLMLGWRAEINKQCRDQAASDLYSMISEYCNKYSVKQIVMMGHSHGGNVINTAAYDISALRDKNVDVGIFMGTPDFDKPLHSGDTSYTELSKQPPFSTRIKLYSYADEVEALGTYRERPYYGLGSEAADPRLPLPKLQGENKTKTYNVCVKYGDQEPRHGDLMRVAKRMPDMLALISRKYPGYADLVVSVLDTSLVEYDPENSAMRKSIEKGHESVKDMAIPMLAAIKTLDLDQLQQGRLSAAKMEEGTASSRTAAHQYESIYGHGITHRSSYTAGKYTAKTGEFLREQLAKLIQ